MARPLRIEFPGALYHVTTRGDRRELIYDDDVDRQAFLEVMARVLERFDACVLAYCLMGNHYHLVLHTRRPNLSALMRQINGVYTQTYNRRHDKVGHLFQGRFKAILVDRDAYMLEVCRYVDLNPVRAGMVAEPGLWPWSSYCAHVGLAAVPSWLDTPAMHGYLLGQDAATPQQRRLAALRYSTLVAQGKDVMLWKDALKNQIYLGDESFIARMQSLLEPGQATAGEIPRIQRRVEPMTIREYLDGHRRDDAVAQAHIEGGHTMTAIASSAGLSVSRVSRLIRKWETERAKGKT